MVQGHDLKPILINTEPIRLLLFNASTLHLNQTYSYYINQSTSLKSTCSNQNLMKHQKLCLKYKKLDIISSQTLVFSDFFFSGNKDGSLQAG